MADTRIDELRRRLERDPGSRLFAQLAEELRKNGELVEAIRVARAGLAEHPSYPSARLTLGRALLDSSDAAGARAELEHTLREAPDNILASRFLAQAREALGDLKGAVEQYEKTLQMSPGDLQLQAQLSAVEAKLRGQGPVGAGSAPSSVPPTVRMQAAGPAPAVAAPPLPPLQLPPPAAPPPPPPLPVQLAPLAPAPPPPPPPPLPRGAADRPVHAAGASEPRPMDETARLGPRVREEATAAPAGTGEDMWFAEAAAEPGLPATLVDPAQSAPTITTQAFSPARAPSPAPPPPAPPLPAAAPAPAATNAAPPAASIGAASSAPFSSSTLAELYFQQGLVDRAVDVYRQLVQQEPANEKARLRLVELETGGAGPEDRAARRRALERTIAGLENLLAAVQRR